MSPTAEQRRSGAPLPRRKSFSKLRRRLSQTFQFSFSGSRSESHNSLNIKDDRGRSSKLSTFSSITRRLSISSSMIFFPVVGKENCDYNSSAAPIKSSNQKSESLSENVSPSF